MDKLTIIEANVLKYIIKNGSATKGIPINIPNIETPYLIQAIKNLHNLGLVVDCSDTLCASALLTETGLTYFEELEKEKYGELYYGIKIIDDYINKAEKLKSSTDKTQLNTFIRQIYLAYCDNFKEDAVYGFQTSFGSAASNELDSYYADLDYIIILLEKIKDKKIYEAKTLQMEKFKIENIINNKNENNIDINITLTQSIEEISKCSELTSDEKIELQTLLIDALKEKNKKSLWEKTKTIFSKIANKTIDVAIAVLPVLIQAMQGK